MHVTSLEANARVPEFRHEHHSVIRAALKRIGTGTFYEIADASNLTPAQVWRRLSELERGNAISVVYSGDVEVTRPGPSGRQCRVWQTAIPYAMAA